MRRVRTGTLVHDEQTFRDGVGGPYVTDKPEALVLQFALVAASILVMLLDTPSKVGRCRLTLSNPC